MMTNNKQNLENDSMKQTERGNRKMSEIPETPATPEKPAEKKQRDWREYFNVSEDTKVDTVNRLDIMVGVNQYKGQTAIFMCKVTDRGRCQNFNPLPPYLWEKAIPIINDYVGRIAEIEKQAMVDNVKVELERLAGLGVDISALIKEIA